MDETVDIVIEDPRWEAMGLEVLAIRAAEALFADLGLAGFSLCLLGCDDARIAALNADFRGKPVATNVLSWPSEERAAAREGDAPAAPDAQEPELGDIALAYETCVAEAEAAGKPVADHVTHLVLHGLLHLLGYDHIRDGDAELMEAVEVRVLASLGISDPYCSAG